MLLLLTKSNFLSHLWFNFLPLSQKSNIALPLEITAQPTGSIGHKLSIRQNSPISLSPPLNILITLLHAYISARNLQFLLLFIFLWIKQSVFQRMTESVFSTNTSTEAETGKYSFKSPLKTIKRECFRIYKFLFQQSTFDIHRQFWVPYQCDVYRRPWHFHPQVTSTSTSTSSPTATTTSPSPPASSSTSPTPVLASSLLSGTWWTL